MRRFVPACNGKQRYSASCPGLVFPGRESKHIVKITRDQIFMPFVDQRFREFLRRFVRRKNSQFDHIEGCHSIYFLI